MQQRQILIAFKYCVKREDKTDQSNPQNKKKKKTDATKLFLKVKKTDSSSKLLFCNSFNNSQVFFFDRQIPQPSVFLEERGAASFARANKLRIFNESLNVKIETARNLLSVQKIVGYRFWNTRIWRNLMKKSKLHN